MVGQAGGKPADKQIMNESRIRVEIVAPVHNRREITLQCLRSLSKIESGGLNVHIVIVDDGSTDGTADAIKAEFPTVEVVAGDGNLWFTEGTNVGVRAALEHDPKYILTINDDSVFDADFLRCMVDTAEKNKRSIVGSLLLLWDTPHRLFQVAPVWNTWMGGWRHWYHQTIWTIPNASWKVDVIVGNCVLFPAEAVRQGGLMDSKNYPNFGDSEYTPRLKRLGWELLIDPRARVFCQPNNIPVRVLRQSMRQRWNSLIGDTGNPYNLRRRFRSGWDAAPTKVDALLAFGIFLARIAARKNVEGAWGMQQAEISLRETFKDKVVQ